MLGHRCKYPLKKQTPAFPLEEKRREIVFGIPSYRMPVPTKDVQSECQELLKAKSTVVSYQIYITLAI